MDIPCVGVGVPSFGPHASPDGIVAVAQTAEHLGFHSVWTFERLLLPAPPDGDNPYGLPEHNASVYDPLETLTWVAAHTQRIRLGTSVLDALFHPPIVLRVNPAQVDAADPTAPFTGAAPAVIADLGRAARAGVDEVIWDLTMAGLDPHRQVDVLQNLAATLRT